MFGYEDFMREFANTGYTLEEVEKDVENYILGHSLSSICSFETDKGRRDIPLSSMFRKDNSEIRDIG